MSGRGKQMSLVRRIGMQKKEERIRRAPIRRLARRAGVKRIGGQIYDLVHENLQKALDNVFRDAFAYAEHAKRQTIIPSDIVAALKRQGNILYGFSGATMLAPTRTTSKQTSHVPAPKRKGLTKREQEATVSAGRTPTDPDYDDEPQSPIRSPSPVLPATPAKTPAKKAQKKISSLKKGIARKGILKVAGQRAAAATVVAMRKRLADMEARKEATAAQAAHENAAIAAVAAAQKKKRGRPAGSRKRTASTSSSSSSSSSSKKKTRGQKEKAELAKKRDTRSKTASAKKPAKKGGK